MIRLDPQWYSKVLPMIQGKNELSVYAVLHQMLPGKVYVDCAELPRAALIQTSECNYLAGKSDIESFHLGIRERLDFWDQLTPDSEAWAAYIPIVHPNRMIRPYIRLHYQVSPETFCPAPMDLGQGITIEKVDLLADGVPAYQNMDKIVDWAESFGTADHFMQYSVGCYARKGDCIASWSLTDCVCGKTAAVGIHTDFRFRGQGFGIAAASAAVQACLNKGYQAVDWLCVDSNKGSKAIAERLGFQLVDTYTSYTPFPPIENARDYTEAEWREWGDYYKAWADEEPRLLTEQLFAYVKRTTPRMRKNRW